MRKAMKKIVSKLLIFSMIGSSLFAGGIKSYAEGGEASPTDAISDMNDLSFENQYENYNVTLKVLDQWDEGKNVEIEIQNTGNESILNWAFKYDVKGSISSIWNAQVVDSKDSIYVIKNDGWNYEIKPGDSVKYGYTLMGDEDISLDSFELVSKKSVIQEGYEVNYQVLDKWNDGFKGEIEIINKLDRPIESWEIEFESDFKIIDYWGCKLLDNSDNYIATCEEWTNIIPVDGSIKFGFVGQISDSLEPIADHFALTDYEILYDFDIKETAEIELYTDCTEIQMMEQEQNVVVYAYTDYEVPEICVYDKESGEIIGKLLDDGQYEQSYDDMQGDGVYSGTVGVETLNKDNIILVAKYKDDELDLYSNNLSIDIYKLLSEEDFKNIHLVIDKISDLTNSEEYFDMDIDERYQFVLSMLDDIAENGIAGNKDASIKKDSVIYSEETGVFTFEYICGGFGFVSLCDYVEGMAGNGVYNNSKNVTIFDSDMANLFEKDNNLSLERSDENSRKALIIDEYGDFSVDTTLSQMSANWKSLGVNSSVKKDPTVAELKNCLKGYTYIYIGMHGSYAIFSKTQQYEPFLHTREESIYTKDYTYSVDISTGRVLIDNSNKNYALTNSFFKHYYSNNKLDGSIVFCEVCSGFGVAEDSEEYDTKLGDAFTSAGAECAFGYTNDVYSDYSRELCSEIVSHMEDGLTTGVSFDKAKAKVGNNSTEWIMKKSNEYEMASYPHLHGNKNYKFYNNGSQIPYEFVYDKLTNPSFEEDSLSSSGLIKAWTTGGDARVVKKLGGLKPQDGKNMLMISTGIGSAESKYVNGNEGSYASQSFIVPNDAQTISFSYDVISEEPMEYVGSQYDDKFDVYIISNGKKDLAVEETINKSKWYKIIGVDFAGGDKTVYHTQWNLYQYDISKYKGQEIKLVFCVTDVGDSLYDTAALIDNIKVD